METLTSEYVQIVPGLPPMATSTTICAFDTEWFGMNKSRLHRPHGKFASMACTYDGKTVYYISRESQIPEFIQRISPAIWAGHHIAFDIRQLRMFAPIPPRKRVWDTMLIEQIRFRGYYDDFGLADLYRRYCKRFLDKSEQKSFENTTSLTDEQIVYGALDVVATWEIAQKQREEIDARDLEIWQKIERPFMWLLLDLDGIALDVERWVQLAEQKERSSSQIWKECFDEYGINIRSPKQILEFFQKNGLLIDGTSEDVLKENAEKHPIIKKILEYRKPAKSSSTYGKKWLEEFVEPDGKIYADWNQMGARSGRMSCSSPNLQNIPARSESDYRDCFIADDGHNMIVADWSSQEPRITAFMSKDEKLIAIFRNGEDIYCSTGFHVFGEKFDKKNPKRQMMKALVLGLSYGMTKYGLAEKISAPEGKDTIKYAQYLIDRYMEEFPGVKRYIQNQISKARKQGYVETIYGRKCWISPYSPGLERDAPNYSIQGSGADAMKLAAIEIHERGKELFGYSPIRMFVHDELVCSVKEEHTEAAAELIRTTMIKVAENMHVGIPANAEIAIGKSWACKK